MQMNPERLYAAERPDGSFELMDLNCWDAIVEAGSKEEMDLKLAVMGLKTDWDGYDWNNPDRPEHQHRVWRIQ